jgi:RNA polymerase sigma factor (sigma-70 family)
MEGEAAAEFTALRPLLFSVAYRMLGSASDAEDVVQEAWLRFAPSAGGIRDPRAWLLRATTRLCLDELGSARARREHYVGPWLPEPVLTGGEAADPLAVVERRELLSLGALTMLERLSPAERAVLVLREAVGLSHAEIAAAAGVSEAGSRQLLSRARRRLTGEHARTTPPPGAQARLVAALRRAFDDGDLGALVDLLREDVVLVGDGGGEVLTARRPILGLDRVLRLLAGLRGRAPATLRLAVAAVNGEPAILVQDGRRPEHIAALVLDAGGRLALLLLVSAPGKLAYARRQAGEAVTSAAPASS